MSAIFLLLVLLIGATIYVFLSPIFNIKSIEVINNSNISSKQIINLSGLSTNENILKFSKKEAENKIASNPYIEEVKIKTNIFSNKVEINVKERVATLMLEYGNSYAYINNQGYILEISTQPINSPIIKGYVTPLEEIKPGHRLCKDDLERLETVLKIIETANSNGIGNLITHLDIKDKKDYAIFLESEDKTVYLGTCSDLSTQVLYIKEMLEREKGIEGEFFVDMNLNTSNPVFREKV
ncbi:MAG: FtsQ-type POTRA domain-containing protein [Bacilli bacterium]|nr:FtsQ-type POTRA domain-containing protein [Bacilli bacterium]